MMQFYMYSPEFEIISLKKKFYSVRLKQNETFGKKVEDQLQQREKVLSELERRYGTD